MAATITSVRSLENNIGTRLTKTAEQFPDVCAVAVPGRRDEHGKRQYDQLTFRQLDEESSQIAAALRDLGVCYHQYTRCVVKGLG